MQQLAAVAIFGFQGMREGMAQVQQRAAVAGFLLTLVIHHHGGLEGAGRGYGFGLQASVAVDQRLTVRLAPFVKRGVADQPGLDDFCVARLQLPARQGGQRTGIGQHDARLVKCAEQVLAEIGIDAGFTADAGIHLRQ